MSTAPRHLPYEPFIALGAQGHVIEDHGPTQTICGRNTSLHEYRFATYKNNRHGAGVQAIFRDGGEQISHIQARLGIDDSFCLVREAAGITPWDALDLRHCQRKAQDTLRLFVDLIDATDHAPLQAAVGGDIGETVAQTYRVHCLTADARYDDGRLVQ